MDDIRPMDSLVYDFKRTAVDPVTFEVVHHRLISISEEQAATLSAISGSPLVNDATDFNTGIFGMGGEIITLGKTVLFHAASVAEMVKHIVKDCADSPGIRPGDMFMVNHPYKGALHPPDFGLVAPVFHKGKLIAWTGVCSHQIDVGSVPGPSATEVRQEGILVPPVRIVENEEFRSDIMGMILGASRAPVNMSLDFRGMMAANRVALQRLAETIEQYGVDVVMSVMQGSIELSEKAVRERLRKLPDGIYRAQTFLDHDGVQNKLYRIHVEVTKKGDELTLDFSKSADQAPRFMNCTESGLLAGVRAGMLPILAFDVPWNEGVFKPMKVIARPGSIVSATFPAPVGQGPIGAMWLVETTVTEVLSKLVATSPELIGEQSTDGGLAGAHEASEHDVAGVRGSHGPTAQARHSRSVSGGAMSARLARHAARPASARALGRQQRHRVNRASRPISCAALRLRRRRSACVRVDTCGGASCRRRDSNTTSAGDPVVTSNAAARRPTVALRGRSMSPSHNDRAVISAVKV